MKILTQLIEDSRKFFGRKKINRNLKLNQKEKNEQRQILKSYPIRAYLELTNACNLRCSMCPQSFLEGAFSFIPDRVLEKITPFFKYFKEVSLFGFGESLLDKRFFKILSLFPEWVTTRLVTNGILMSEPVCEKMVESPLKDLYISLDAAKEETYYSIRGKNEFSTIISNIQTLNEIKKRKNSEYPKVALAYTFMRKNIEEFLDFIKLAKELNIPKITGDYLIVYRQELISESLFFHQEITNYIFRKARELASRLNIELLIPLSFEEAKKNKKANISAPETFKFCYEPWEFVYFRADGYLSPCCVNNIKLADLNTTDYFSAWNSPEYQKFRATVNTTRDDPNCQQCMDPKTRDILNESFHIKLIDTHGNVMSSNEKKR